MKRSVLRALPVPSARRGGGEKQGRSDGRSSATGLPPVLDELDFHSDSLGGPVENVGS